MVNKTSEALANFVDSMTEFTVSSHPKQAKEFISIAEKFKRMEEDLRSIVNICDNEKIKNFAKAALDFDPLSQ